MAEVKLRNLFRLSKPRNKFDSVILAVHACLVERGFRCINSGEEVRLYVVISTTYAYAYANQDSVKNESSLHSTITYI